MAAGGGVNRKISAASARAHTRKAKQNTSFNLPSGLFTKILLVLSVGALAWAYQAIQSPPPKICGSPGGPPVTASRIELRDGRHLAYEERGVPRDAAKHKIILVHGFGSCRLDTINLSLELVERLGIYIVSFDRPGYGESDPNPKQTVKSMALDIEELADQLRLGSKFYVIGVSMGGQVTWSCLKYIPHRLAGATLIAPAVNYWWSGLPTNLSNQAYQQLLPQDQWVLRVSHYAPWLTYWWNTQKWFPSSSILANSIDILSSEDIKVLMKMPPRNHIVAHLRQQGEYESLHRDMIVGFGKWEFSPVELDNPFPNNEGSVHLWQGDEDKFVPVMLQRYIAQQLPWIQYHELPGAGHMFALTDGMWDNIVEALLVGEK
ncbi:hypothetical protein V6N13_067502 [Hibiscus sabdariffa]